MSAMLLALDIGTTHIKAALADEALQIRHIYSVKNRADLQDAALGACYGAGQVWQRVAAAIQGVLALCPGTRVAAVGITGMADTGLPVDAHNTPLLPVQLWSNPCGGEAHGEILAQYGREQLAGITGQALHVKFALSRLVWLQRSQPAALAKMDCWLSLYDYILLKLTGERVTDDSIACRTMLYDMHRGEWHEGLCTLAGVKGRLPRVVPRGQAVGRLLAKTADGLGLPPDIPVASGGHDHVCALAGLLRQEPGSVLNSLGTAEVFVGEIPAKADFTGSWRYGINTGCLGGGKKYWLASLPSSGASYEWLCRLAGMEYDELLANLPQDAGGVTYLPHLNGSGTPQPDATKRGVLLGLGTQTGPGHLVRAVSEGLGFEARRILEAVQPFLGAPVPQLALAGGGTHNAALLSARANITGCTLHPASQQQLTAYGALLAAAGCLDALPQPPEISFGLVAPAPGCPQRYNEAYARYKALCALGL